MALFAVFALAIAQSTFALADTADTALFAQGPLALVLAYTPIAAVFAGRAEELVLTDAATSALCASPSLS